MTAQLKPQVSDAELYDLALRRAWKSIDVMAQREKDPKRSTAPLDWVKVVADAVADLLIQDHDISKERARLLAWRAISDVQSALLPAGLFIDVEASTESALVLRLPDGTRRTVPLAQLMHHGRCTAGAFKRALHSQQRKANH